MVTVYLVIPIKSSTGLNVAIRLVLSTLTVPAGLVHGKAQVTTMLAPFPTTVTASLNVAVIIGLYTSTSLAFLSGVTLVTEGASAALALVPNTLSLPPQAVIKAIVQIGSSHLRLMEQ